MSRFFTSNKLFRVWVNKRIAFTAADVFLRRNGFHLDVEATKGYELIVGSMERREFRFAQILDWIRQHIKPRS